MTNEPTKPIVERAGGTEDLRALVAKWRAIAEEDKPAKYKVDRPLNEVDGATGYLWLGLQYERGVYEAKLELAYELEALLDAGDPAVAADDVPTVTIMEDVGDPEWFTQPSQCAVKVGLAAELDELKAVAPPPERNVGLELATLSIMFARHGFNPVVGGEYEALIREISALTQPASQPVFATTCTGHQHEDCNYLGFCGSVCNKCGNLLECVTWMTRPARQRGGGRVRR